MIKEVKVNVDSLKKVSCPSSSETDADWQEFFEKMRNVVVPKKHTRITHKDVFLHNSIFYETNQSYDGELLWQRYCSFINGILSSIRRGGKDYCFYIYQVAELLQFEHDRLRTQWMPKQECFKVWLAPEGV